MRLISLFFKVVFVRLIWKLPLSILFIISAIIFFFAYNAVYSEIVFLDSQYYEYDKDQIEYFNKNNTFEQKVKKNDFAVNTYAHPLGQGYVEVYYFDDRIEYIGYGAKAKEYTKTEYFIDTVSSTTDIKRK